MGADLLGVVVCLCSDAGRFVTGVDVRLIHVTACARIYTSILDWSSQITFKASSI